MKHQAPLQTVIFICYVEQYKTNSKGQTTNYRIEKQLCKWQERPKGVGEEDESNRHRKSQETRGDRSLTTTAEDKLCVQ